MADCHAQLKPLYYREPSLNLGVGEASGRLPHITGAELLDAFGIAERSPNAYMLSSDDYEALAKTYGRVGGMDRMATLVKAIRAERGAERVLLLDGGDALQGSYTALETKGGDMVAVLQALGVEATTGHWEFTLGARARRRAVRRRRTGSGSSGLDVPRRQRARHRLRGAGVPSLAHVREGRRQRRRHRPGLSLHADRQSALDDARAGRSASARRSCAGRWPQARAQGARSSCCSRTTASTSTASSPRRVEGIDVILTAHTHDALPQPVQVGDTLLIASGSHGKFLSRLDLEVERRARAATSPTR